MAYPFESQHKHCLTFSHMFNEFRQLIRQFPDQRTGQNTVYSIEDVALGAFSVQGFRAINEQLLIALDGTQYHCSNKIHCNSCTVTEHKKGQTRYSHTVITPVVVAPDCKRVIPLEPEFIIPQDGHQKQDGEMAAAQRWLTQYAERYRELKVTLWGDDLYSRQPLCEQVIAAGLNFIFVCKPQSHITLYDWLDGLDKSQAVQTLKIVRRKVMYWLSYSTRYLL